MTFYSINRSMTFYLHTNTTFIDWWLRIDTITNTIFATNSSFSNGLAAQKTKRYYDDDDAKRYWKKSENKLAKCKDFSENSV